MAEPLIVCSHLSGEQTYQSERFRIISVQCQDELDYWHGITSAWSYDGPLVIIEHDMEVNDDLVAELVDCPHALCTHAYDLHWPSTHKPHSVSAQRIGPQAYMTAEYATGAWCDFTGIGFCKIAPEARARPIEESHWSQLDVAVTRAVEGRWHVHRPGVEHHHW